jgi:hypothetical protein
VSRPTGLTPEEIESAYRLPAARRSHQTLAVSIAYDTPNLARYLTRYRSYFGLPPVACPYCKILVVEASNDSTAALADTEDAAARLGAQVISNSYGQREDGAALAFASSYHHPGHVIVASSGDTGYTAANFPADLSAVTAVGGTQITTARNKRG